MADYYEPDFHCPDDYGGSHYHCAYCGESTGMTGHLKNNGKLVCSLPSDRKGWWSRFVTNCWMCKDPLNKEMGKSLTHHGCRSQWHSALTILGWSFRNVGVTMIGQTMVHRCTRPYHTQGPCNGYPRKDCPRLRPE